MRKEVSVIHFIQYIKVVIGFAKMLVSLYLSKKHISTVKEPIVELLKIINSIHSCIFLLFYWLDVYFICWKFKNAHNLFYFISFMSRIKIRIKTNANFYGPISFLRRGLELSSGTSNSYIKLNRGLYNIRTIVSNYQPSTQMYMRMRNTNISI